MWNTDAFGFQESTDPIYKSIPFFIDYATGALLRRPPRQHLAHQLRLRPDSDRHAYSFGAEGGPLDYYFLYGPDPKQVIETYAWLTGPSPLPPLWSLGFQQSRYSYYSASRGYSRSPTACVTITFPPTRSISTSTTNKNRPFTVIPSAFPDLPSMIADVGEQHFHVVAITDLHIANLPDQGYAPYDSGIAG